MKTIHGASVSGSRLSPTEESILNRIVPGGTTTMTPVKHQQPPAQVQHVTPQHAQTQPPPQPVVQPIQQQPQQQHPQTQAPPPAQKQT